MHTYDNTTTGFTGTLDKMNPGALHMVKPIIPERNTNAERLVSLHNSNLRKFVS
jgi:hypothetical protein